jgi:hypothetical protein
VKYSAIQVTALRRGDVVCIYKDDVTDGWLAGRVERSIRTVLFSGIRTGNLTLEDETNTLSRNIGKEKMSWHHITE